ncbi:MAG: condensation domain-containing protein [Chitinophagales bacterium]
MKTTQNLIRPLSAIEQAFTLSNDALPLCVVCVLQLDACPESQDIQLALQQLQSRHILLQAEIVESKGDFYFSKLEPAPPIRLEIVYRTNSATWKAIAEKALNTIFDKKGPLMKCCAIADDETNHSELVVCFHHAIIDGTSARLVLHELLSLLGGLSLPTVRKSSVASKFPADYQGWNLAKRLFAFGGRQMKDEWTYLKRGFSSTIPIHSSNAVINLLLSPEVSRKLMVHIGRKGLSLNSALLAVMTQVILKHKYGNVGRRLARVISFVDTRSLVTPVVGNQDLGCCISMLRLTVPVADGESVYDFAANIRREIFKSSRLGEVFLMSKVSKYLIRMTLALKKMRLGVSALSFIGKLDLQPQYGAIQLQNVQAFITNNQFGPDFSAFGKILFGGIGMDFTYLTAEMDETQAQQIVTEIKEKLEEMANFA